MILKPIARPVRIRIVSGEMEHSSLASLRANFSLFDLIEPLKDGRLSNWLIQNNNEGLAQKLSQFSDLKTVEDRKHFCELFEVPFSPDFCVDNFDALKSMYKDDNDKTLENIKRWINRYEAAKLFLSQEREKEVEKLIVQMRIDSGDETLLQEAISWAKKYRDADDYAKSILKKYFKLEFVDLGLSVKWADCNLGASCPEKMGDLYCWGEIEPASIDTSKGLDINLTSIKGLLSAATSFKMLKEKELISDNPVCYAMGLSYKRLQNEGIIDYDLELRGEKDVATLKIGDFAWTPSRENFEELINRCTWEWQCRMTLDGFNVKGYAVTGPSGKSIFLPFGGILDDDRCGYWSSRVDGGYSDYAYCMAFETFDRYVSADVVTVYKTNKLPIRPVSD